jgi:hypothetical protein
LILNNYQILLSALETANTMKKLASNCKAAIRHGCFEPLADKYRPMINDLPLDMGIIDLADILSWGVYTSKNDSTTAMELLTALDNR